MTLSRFSTPILALLLATASTSLAQQQPDAAPQANITCDDLADYVSPNATATVNMTALTIMYLGEENEDGEYDRILIDKDMQSTWHVSSWIQAVDAESGNLDAANDTQAVLWLETGDTDMQRVGEVLNMCHDYVPWRNGSTGELAFSREVLERAADDKGDCRTMLGAACVNALRQRYWNEATAEWSIDGRCIATRTGVPDECEGVLMVEPTSLQPAPLNSTFSDRLEYWTGNSTSDSFPQNATGPICDDLNLNNSYGTKIPTTVDYDFALNFPTVNILTFFANVEGANSLTGRDLMAEVVCLKPERAQEGSRVPRSAEEVLDELFGKRDDDQQDDQQDDEQDDEQDNGEQGNGGQGDGEQDSGDQDDGGQDGGQEAQDEDSAAQRTFGIGGKAMLASVFGAIVAFALSL